MPNPGGFFVPIFDNRHRGKGVSAAEADGGVAGAEGGLEAGGVGDLAEAGVAVGGVE